MQLKQVIFLLAGYVSLFSAAPAWCANRDVCATCSYTDIGSALLAAGDGDVIRIASGSYGGIENWISIGSTNNVLRVEGGYTSNFSARDGETILNAPVQINPSYGGVFTIDGVTITGNAGTAIYFASSKASLTVNNCHIYDNGQSAITIAPYYPDYDQDISANFTITNNLIHGHAAYGAVELNLSDPAPYAATILIANNVVYDTAGSYAANIRLVYSGSGTIAVQDNEVYGGEMGMYLQTYAGDPQLDVSGNSVHDNRSTGIKMYGAPTTDDKLLVHHNRVYRNVTWGIYHYLPRASSYYNNTFAYQDRGLQLIHNSGSPKIWNNIFYQHSYYGLGMTADEAGWGGTAILPRAVKYNNFYNSWSGAGYLHSGSYPAYNYYAELPDDYNDMNQFLWAAGNIREQPRFVDAGNGDFHLQSDSFCIDEGDPSLDSAAEPSPNGARLNLGAFGASVHAETSSVAVTISDVRGSQSAADVDVSFSTTTSTAASWLSIEYFDGSTYQPVPPSALSGAGVGQGYNGIRVPTGSGRTVTWQNAKNLLGSVARSDVRLRVTASHGAEASIATSPNFAVDYVPPTVVLTSPTNGAYIALTGEGLSATAADVGTGVGSVQFQYKSEGAGSYTSLGGDADAPYSGSLAGAALAPGGRYVVRAVATDGSGNSAESSAVTVTVCSFTLGQSSVSIDAAAHMQSVAVNTPGGSCAWAALSTVGWITVSSGASGAGDGTVSLSIAANDGVGSRSGSVTIAGQTFSVTQAGVACAYSLASTTSPFDYRAGSGNLTINVNHPSCGWLLSSSAGWISISAPSGTGGATVPFSVSENPGQSARHATIAFGAQSVTISQGGVPPPPDPTPTPEPTPAPDPSPTPEPEPQLLQLQLGVNGPGEIRMLSASSTCGVGCYVFTPGDTVTLEAGTVRSSTFNGWTGSCYGAGTTCAFQMYGDESITAVFTPHPVGITWSTSQLRLTKKKAKGSVTLRNVSGAPLRITSAYTVSSGHFSTSRIKKAIVLKPRKSKAIGVSFKSKASGTFNGQLVITTDDPYGEPIVVSLAGIR